MSYSSSLIFRPEARLGLRKNDRLSSGVRPNLFQGQLATNQCIAAAEVTLKDGHKAPDGFSTIACRLGSASIKTCPSAEEKFPAQCIALQRRNVLKAGRIVCD
jgi:hypothetical protein